jgi:Xaa-Pro aminopeptidase
MKLLQLQQYLKKEHINLAFFVHPDINITYLTQIKASFSLLIVNKSSVKLYLSSLDKVPKIKNVKIEKLTKDWGKELINNKVKKVGIDKGSITVSFFEKLKKIYPKAKFINISNKLKELRSLKTEQEIKKIKKACNITDKTFSAVLENLKKGKFKTEQQVSLFIENKIKEQGAELAFPTIVASGKNSSIPHHNTSSNKLKRGFLLFDFGAKYDNYCSDMSRTIFLGKPSKDEVEKYNLLLSVQKKALKEIKKGKLLLELEKNVRKNLGKFSSHFIHSLGHGVGIEIHEQPSFSHIDKQKITPKQVFTIEPGIYFPNKYGIRIEDTVLFDGKLNILTKSSKELIKIKI